MSSARILRTLIVAMWVITILGGVLDSALEPRLPNELRSYLADESNRQLATWDWVGMITGLVAFLFLLAGSVHLYRLRSHGRRTFLIGLVLSVVLMPLFGHVVYNAWAAPLYEASLILGGVIIGWIYLPGFSSPLSDPVIAPHEPKRPPAID